MVNTSTHSPTLAAAAAAFVAAFGLPLLIGSASLAVPRCCGWAHTECSGMAHPPAAQNPLTRPGQLDDLNQPPAPNSDMPMDCIPIGHG